MSDNNTTAETASVPNQPTPELTIVDLQNLRSIVDVAARRGAFGAGEMAAVGSVFSKLDTFLNAAVPPVAEEAAAEQK